ncbi:MAG: SUMF1/EgtB/PvdO family nonheme iron enzyme, partial [Crocinitomicaceae bacterium]|nr:SUMF1/EgtB/PvdO family nonheme iron enzyme [Crocinitomicaceae bacterium]
LSNYPWGGPYARNIAGVSMANFVQISQGSIFYDTIWQYGKFYDPKTESYSDSIKCLKYVSGGGDYYMGVAGVLNDGADVTAPVESYWPNGYGLYNMAGNAEELVDAYYQRDLAPAELPSDEELIKSHDPSGVTRGGSWRDPGYYALVSSRQYYSGKDYSSEQIGFRLVMEVVEH